MTEVAKPVRQAVDPLSGELVDLAAQTTTDLAEARDRVREVRDAVSSWARSLDEEITARLDFEARRSVEVGGWKVESQSPTLWETDTSALHEALTVLVNEGVLSPHALDAALQPVETVKASRRGLNALHKHADPRVRQVVGEYDREVENPNRRVTVKRA